MSYKILYNNIGTEDPYKEIENFRGYTEVANIELPFIGLCKIIVLEKSSKLKFDIVSIDEKFHTSLLLESPEYDYSDNDKVPISKLSDYQLDILVDFLQSPLHDDIIKYFINKPGEYTIFDLIIVKCLCTDDSYIERARYLLDNNFSIPNYLLLKGE